MNFIKEKWKASRLQLEHRLTKTDYVQCLNCGYESARVDNYLDIPLVIKAFGSETAVQSIEEALEKFVEVETLNGDNKYHCDHCKGKVLASNVIANNPVRCIEGIEIQVVPLSFDSTLEALWLWLHLHEKNQVTRPGYILRGLNRFLSYSNLMLQILDMNQFLETGTASLSQSIRRKKILHEHNLGGDGEEESDSQQEMKEEAAEDAHTKGKGTSNYYLLWLSFRERRREQRIWGLQASVGRCLEEWYVRLLPPPNYLGPYVYELYAILVHRGTSMGGHYYAYIKVFFSWNLPELTNLQPFSSGKWHCFNDSTVSVASKKDLEEAYGGATKGTKQIFRC